MHSLSKTNLADTAAEAIRAEILARRWTIGEKLPNEATLSTMLSVSRGTVREAVRVLVSQGILETRQGSGTYVLSTADTTRPLTMARRAGLRDLIIEGSSTLAGQQHMISALWSEVGKDKAAFLQRIASPDPWGDGE